MKRKRIQNVVGIAAVVLLLILVVIVFLESRKPETEKETKKVTATIEFDSEELVFDGSGKLNLLEGVVATDSDGKTATDRVEAFITSDGTTSRKTIRYTLSDTSGRIISKKRTLVMKNYEGPSLFVKDMLTLSSDDLKNLINILKDSGYLKAEDGYGRDITSSVRCIREKKDNGLYTMEFSVVNVYEDFKKVSVTASIEGNVTDPEIMLSETEIQLKKNSYFDALKYVAFSTDGASDYVSDKIEIDSSVDTSKPGDYRVVYRLYSADKTAVTTKVLKVTVEI